MKKKHGDQKLVIKIMLVVIVIVLGVLYKVSSSTIIEDQLEGVENQVATTLYKENQGAGGNGGSGGTGSVIPGGGDSGNNGSENGGSQTVDKTTVQELPNYATKLNPDGTTPSLTTKTVVGQDLDSLKNALVSNNVLSESEAANVDGIVVITGDVSNVGSLEVDTSKYCSSGETVVVVTYDETTKTYSYVGKATVGSDGKVTVDVNGGSSHTDFATKDETGSIVAGVSKAAGLYDANGNMTMTWEELQEGGYITVSDTTLSGGAKKASLSGVLCIDEGITSIAENAFKSCYNITGVNFPKSLKTIGTYAFSDCDCLTEVICNEGLITIDEHAFQNCNNLQRFVSSSTLTTFGYGALSYNTKLSTVELNDKISAIPGGMFNSCSDLKSLFIPKSVTTIGGSAFYSCNAVKLYSDATSIPSGWSTSGNPCVVRTGLDVSRKWYNDVYQYANTVTSITIPGDYGYIPENAFYGCGNLKSVTISEGITEIRANGFRGLNITGINLPKSLKTIGEYAFADCDYFTTVTGNEGLETIGRSAFYHCNSLQSFVCPSTLKVIGQSALSSNTSLSSVTLNDSLSKIQGWVFQSCSNLYTLFVPKGVTIEANAFISNYNTILYTDAETVPSSWSTVNNPKVSSAICGISREEYESTYKK